jgi:hypothetical protein
MIAYTAPVALNVTFLQSQPPCDFIPFGLKKRLASVAPVSPERD